MIDCYLRIARLGARSYIAKPVEFQQFADTIIPLGLYWLVIIRVP